MTAGSDQPQGDERSYLNGGPCAECGRTPADVETARLAAAETALAADPLEAAIDAAFEAFYAEPVRRASDHLPAAERAVRAAAPLVPFDPWRALSPDGVHTYLSTGCLTGGRDDLDAEGHRYCRGELRQDGGGKVPAVCKCHGQPCVCPCHEGGER